MPTNNEIDIKKNIETSIKNFVTSALFDAGTNLFQTLGYNTELTNGEQNFSYNDFIDLVDGKEKVNTEKIIANDWKTCELLFQLTDDTLNGNHSLFGFDFSTAKDIYKSYLFFALELSGDHYSRSELATITREMNKPFMMPVFVLFKYADKITLSVIDRRPNINDDSRDVLEKITMIKDISIAKPQRAHIEIFYDLSFAELLRVHSFTNFDELHKAWKETLNLKELNNKFYKELSNWYFWAMQNVKFPGADFEAEKDSLFSKEEKQREYYAQCLIRLICRLLFVWFIKEKRLVPENLFDTNYINTLLKEFYPEHLPNKSEQGSYYKAVLQNLFFAVLNQEKEKRSFKNENSLGVGNEFRYGKLIKVPQDDFVKVFDKVPFMNGGLFECLDEYYKGEGKIAGKEVNKKNYFDGFSDNNKYAAIVPDYLFFAKEETADLSKEYDTNKMQAVKVHGLINILNHYKFTIEENTPIEEDIALDPELLGRVFENLLASFNPETKTTARKSTGSYYTPREIVDYMVNESIKAYLQKPLVDSGMGPDEAVEKLETLAEYNESENPFDENQTKILIDAIDKIKVLDPACGSGAFPMGMLHKLVYLLKKLDPENTYWKEAQAKKLGEEMQKTMNISYTKEERMTAQKELNDIFDSTMYDPDYSRKMYLIENCIYGVDIQPIATQISKLRFFISLVTEQNTDESKQNCGVRPLPNLETKFVAANTLIDITKGEGLMKSNRIIDLEKELKEIRHKIFSVKTVETKLKYRAKDKEIREQIADELQAIGWGQEESVSVAQWDPYDKKTSSGWFNAEWMFGVDSGSRGQDSGSRIEDSGGRGQVLGSSGGFDVVIGNPPYGAKVSDAEKKYYKQHYAAAQTKNGVKGSTDTFAVFIEMGHDLLKTGGNLAFIVPMSVTSSDAMRALHNKIESDCSEIRVSSYAVRPKPVFENAVVNTSIIAFVKDNIKCKKIYSTKMHRRTENFNLQYLLDNLQFTQVQDLCLIGRIPKIGTIIERSILKKVLRQTKISEYKNENGNPIYYRTTGGRYFKVVTNYETGSTKEKPLIVVSEMQNLIGCILSSNLAFWFYQIYSNNLDWKSFEIESFTIPNLTELQTSKLEALYSEYLEDIERNANIRTSSGNSSYNVSSFKEYKIVKSKPIIDRIDDLICPLYGLTTEETEFIKNYELEARMSGGE